MEDLAQIDEATRIRHKVAMVGTSGAWKTTWNFRPFCKAVLIARQMTKDAVAIIPSMTRPNGNRNCSNSTVLLIKKKPSRNDAIKSGVSGKILEKRSASIRPEIQHRPDNSRKDTADSGKKASTDNTFQIVKARAHTAIACLMRPLASKRIMRPINRAIHMPLR